MHGGKLIMVPYSVSRDPDAFHALLQHERVTVLNQTPSAFRQLMAADAQTNAGSDLVLRFVIFGGEALEMHSLRPWFDRHGDAQPQLVNMFGITETTVHVTYRPIRRADLDAARGSMIGVRIPDLRVYILDRHMQPLPIGVAGEIVVGGAGVARGYLNRAALTAERFVADPFTSDTEARLYRSGDLARFTPSGDLEYLGRIDDQVKLRGFRIELGEIEAALTQQPQVRDAVVVLREDTPGDPRLVAYVVSQGETLMAAELRAALEQQLPEYMVPAHWVTLDQFPLTPNGKIDREALPVPEYSSSEVKYRSPGTPMEKAIAELWTQILNLPRVGLDDSFFDLGGHSLLAVRLLNRIRHDLNLDLSLRQLFETPTVSGLAREAPGNPAAAATDRPLSPRA
jgi:acyl-coenzyme A synthetase/AMP-(fatty) acid ligase